MSSASQSEPSRPEPAPPTEIARGDGREGPDPIEAAGGLVWSRGWLGGRLAVIHRARHDDWTLPKGKREAGESLLETALREAREETGCELLPHAFAGLTRHEVDGRAKQVSYWHMESVRVVGPPDGTEVDTLVWLRPYEARARLSYASERELLACVNPPRLPSPLARWLSTWRGDRTRLATSIAALSVDLERRPDAPAAMHGARTWKKFAREHLAQATRKLEAGELAAAWPAYKAAARLEVFGLSGTELAVRAEALRHEAARKLDGWRRESVADILAAHPPREREANIWSQPASDLVVTPGRVEPERLYVALELRDEDADNLYHKLGLRRRQVSILLAALLVSASSLLLLLLTGGRSLLDAQARLPFATPGADGGQDASELANVAGPSFALLLSAVVLAGLVGGAWSALRTLARTPPRARIPDYLCDSWVTSMRPVIGAVGALMVLLFLASGILNQGALSSPLLLAIAFVAGFSEKLVMRGVEALAGGGDGDAHGGGRSSD